MRPNIVFVVHGLGTNLDASAAADAWFTELDAALRASWNQFATLRPARFDDDIELCPLTYDAKFRENLSQVGDHARAVQRALADAEYAKVVGR